MQKHCRVKWGLVLAPVLTLLAGPGAAQPLPSGAPEKGETEQSCLAREFVGCVGEPSTLILGEADLLVTNACGNAYPESINEHFGSLSSECRKKCQRSFDAVLTAIDGQLNALLAYNDAAKKHSQSLLPAPPFTFGPLPVPKSLETLRRGAKIANDVARGRQAEYKDCASAAGGPTASA